jgi:DNA-binding NtrC family response regulator
VSAVLIVDDERGIREGLTAAVEGLGHRALPAPGLAEARRLVLSEAVDCILLDIRLRDGDGLDLLRELRGGAHREIPVVVATAYGDSDRTIEAMRDGAFDYVTKPFDLPLLLATVERALRQRTLQRSLPPRAPPPIPIASGALIGTSAAMLAIWKQIGRAAASDAPVLITGETGTGKELVARAIHEYSPLAKEPFVAVNLAALPASLIESELFGHERGAFTGATARRAGRFELAQGGTLFLDEIGDLDALLQTKLLRVLQDGRFERVGGSDPITCRARVLTATNKPVRPGVPGATLREDLYYRLAVFEIEVPPLRARRSDIPLLVAHALDGSPARAVSEDAMAHLQGYEWPGNVRELLHVLRRAAAMCGGEIIDTPDLPTGVRAETRGREPEEMPLERLSLKEAVAALERRMIADALERVGGNRSEAARQLGIARAQLYLKMEEYGIRGRGERAGGGK